MGGARAEVNRSSQILTTSLWTLYKLHLYRIAFYKEEIYTTINFPRIASTNGQILSSMIEEQTITTKEYKFHYIDTSLETEKIGNFILLD